MKGKIKKQNSFKDRVISVVKSIKEGNALSYKEVAVLAGSPKAYRAVGSIMSKNYNKDVPCHRVVKSDGTTGRYNRGDKLKVKLLKKEGFLPR